MTDEAGAQPTGGARPIVVQKFGGTSVADAALRAGVIERVKAASTEGKLVVAVVSAMGRRGSAYATDTLLGLIRGHEADPRESDMLMACGEIVSAVVVAHELRTSGIRAVALSGPEAGIMTDGRHGDAELLAVDPEPIRRLLSEGLVPVVAGFQGVGPDGALTTMGRGGSDTSACALGIALGAEAIEIYTDVDGVMTADPGECAEAAKLDSMTYRELFEMARHGAGVIHPPAAELAMNARMPLRIRRTTGADPGTTVSPSVLDGRGDGKVARAVSCVAGLARVTVDVAGGGQSRGVYAEVFGTMAHAGISLDMFTPFGDSMVFSVPETSLPECRRALEDAGIRYRLEEGLTKVTLVGAGMHGVPGVMARVAEALDRAGVDMLQTSDSHATISVLVCQNMRKRAVAALHETFGLAEGE